MEQKQSTKIFVDNHADIAISNNQIFHGKTKHFNIKLFFVKEMQDVSLYYCKTKNQLADLFTKPLPTSKFEFLRQKIGVCSSKIKEEC